MSPTQLESGGAAVGTPCDSGSSDAERYSADPAATGGGNTNDASPCEFSFDGNFDARDDPPHEEDSAADEDGDETGDEDEDGDVVNEIEDSLRSSDLSGLPAIAGGEAMADGHDASLDGARGGGGDDDMFIFSYGDFSVNMNGSDMDPSKRESIVAAIRHTKLECDKNIGKLLWRRVSLCLSAMHSFSHFPSDSYPHSITVGETTRTLSSSSGRNPRKRGSDLQVSARRTNITSIDLSVIGDIELETKGKEWIRSFRDLDPRVQILNFFNELSLEGVESFENSGCSTKGSQFTPAILKGFVKSGIFSVWRPTSSDAIRKMITGEGTGKGLDIKGKSAKCGAFSGFVPFLQIHDNGHKKKLGVMRESSRVRVFYPNESSRDLAWTVLEILSHSMKERAESAKKLINGGESHGSIRSALVDAYRCVMNDPEVYKIDDYVESQGIYGIDVNERLFWEGYVVPNDITRPKGSKYETGRPSIPEFQQMNIDTLRTGGSSSGPEAGRRPVLWHGDCGRVGENAPEESNPLCPLGLLMAYEENMKVMPVVSDFDSFLLGTRGVNYHEPLGTQELSMLNMCLNEIEGILATPKEGSSWTQRWLDVKKKHCEDDHHEMPPFGYADPRSYKIMTGAVHRLKSNGAVRHGPECFNYSFPQDLDDQYLVVSDAFPGVPWRYANPRELIDILCEKIDQGFTFPLNPKWILADSGWKLVYDKLMASNKPNVQDSMNIWYPDEVRQRINEISANFPLGFVDPGKDAGALGFQSGVQTDLAVLELRKYMIRMEAKQKIRKALRRGMMAKEIMGDAWQVSGAKELEHGPSIEDGSEELINGLGNEYEDDQGGDWKLNEKYYHVPVAENGKEEAQDLSQEKEIKDELQVEKPMSRSGRNRLKFTGNINFTSKLSSFRKFVKRKSSI